VRQKDQKFMRQKAQKSKKQTIESENIEIGIENKLLATRNALYMPLGTKEIEIHWHMYNLNNT
jgi:hypothetical protein